MSINLGKSIKVALAQNEMKRTELAETMEVSKQQVSNWIRSGTMNLSTLVTICAVLNMPVSEFIALGEGD